MEPNKLIKLLKELKRDDVMVVLTDKVIDSLIDIVEKYQKIQGIMDELNGDFYGSYLKDRQALEKIYEVMDDGNDD